MDADETTGRLEYLRAELRAERISYGELAELQLLADQIEPGDVELLEAAGVPEFPADLPDSEWQRLAGERWGCDDIDFDVNPRVSVADETEHGAWVAAWVWVDHPDA